MDHGVRKECITIQVVVVQPVIKEWPKCCNGYFLACIHENFNARDFSSLSKSKKENLHFRGIDIDVWLQHLAETLVVVPQPLAQLLVVSQGKNIY